MPSSFLHDMFLKQTNLQEKLGNDVNSQAFINEMILCTVDELMEALRETPWKSWKKNQELHTEKFKEEIIDIWHFIINLSLASGMGPQEVYDRFINKNKINIKRQEDNY